MTQDGLEDRAPEAAALARVAAQPVEERNLPLLDLVAEPREHCRQHRQRADHGDARRPSSCRSQTTRTSPEPEKNIPAIAIMTVKPEISTARPEVAAAASRAAPFASSGLALVAFTAQVEERVVDADCEPDQQDDLLILPRPSGRTELTHRDEPHGREDRGQPRPETGTKRRDDRAEHEQQDENRQTATPIIPAWATPPTDQLVERLLGRDSSLSHVEGGVRLLHPGSGGGDRVDVFRPPRGSSREAGR